jgi:hypothetical protein
MEDNGTAPRRNLRMKLPGHHLRLRDAGFGHADIIEPCRQSRPRQERAGLSVSVPVASAPC